MYYPGGQKRRDREEYLPGVRDGDDDPAGRNGREAGTGGKAEDSHGDLMSILQEQAVQMMNGLSDDNVSFPKTECCAGRDTQIFAGRF